jgi:hypothetical protein
MERKYHAQNNILKDLKRFSSSYTAFKIKDKYNSDICSMYCGSNKCICNFVQDLSNGKYVGGTWIDKAISDQRKIHCEKTESTGFIVQTQR